MSKRKNLLIGVGTVAALVLVYVAMSAIQSGDDEKSASGSTSSSSTTTTSVRAAESTRATAAMPPRDTTVPMYVVRQDRDEYLTVLVARLPSQAQLENVLAEVKSDYGKDDGGYHVAFDCSPDMSPAAASRIANGKFAVGAIGAARTGLRIGGSEVVMLDNAACAPPVPETSPDAVTAQDVVDAIKAAGLPATNIRDLTGPSGCLDLGCVQMVAVDAVSVYQFADVTAATKYAEAFADKSYQNGLVVMRYKYDGKGPINPALIPEYNAVLDQLINGG